MRYWTTAAEKDEQKKARLYKICIWGRMVFPVAKAKQKWEDTCNLKPPLPTPLDVVRNWNQTKEYEKNRVYRNKEIKQTAWLISTVWKKARQVGERKNGGKSKYSRFLFNLTAVGGESAEKVFQVLKRIGNNEKNEIEIKRTIYV